MDRLKESAHAIMLHVFAISIAVCAILGMAGADHALASTGERLQRASDMDYQEYVSDYRLHRFGVIGYDGQQRRYYCMDQSHSTDYTLGDAEPMPDTLAARTVGEMIARHQYEHNVDDLQAALALIVHDAFDTSEGERGWPRARDIIEGIYPSIFDKARELYEEVRPVVPASIATHIEYAEGGREGNVVLEILNDEGAPTTDTAYSLRMEGAAIFSNGSRTCVGRTNGKPLRFAWKADGNGAVRVHAQMQVPGVEKIVSSQNLLRLGAGMTVEASETSFATVAVFSGALVTQTTPKSVDSGSGITDDVSVRLDGDGQWPKDSAVEATGWYFTGLREEGRDVVIRPNIGERAHEFLGRLRRLGFEPTAYGNATFTHDGECKRVQAVCEESGTKPYVAREGDAYGTWVWAVERERQSPAVQQVMTQDWVSAFMEPTETNVTRVPLHVHSQVGERSTHVGAALVDAIEVSGFPQDHGTFGGNEQYGLGADEPTAQVSVWWAGDGNDGDDEPYRPQGNAEPVEDEHHTLIGTWDVPARNGALQFGGGRPDAHGEKVALRAARPGWYAFVWKFKGDSRTMPQASDYGDERECVRVIHGTASAVSRGKEAAPSRQSAVTGALVRHGAAATSNNRVRQSAPNRLAKTGVSMGGVALMGVVIVLIMATMLVARRRRVTSLHCGGDGWDVGCAETSGDQGNNGNGNE